MYVGMHAFMYACMSGWMDGWMDEWTDGWMVVCMYVLKQPLANNVSEFYHLRPRCSILCCNLLERRWLFVGSLRKVRGRFRGNNRTTALAEARGSVAECSWKVRGSALSGFVFWSVGLQIRFEKIVAGIPRKVRGSSAEASRKHFIF